jgi:hypothetical protein
MKTDDYADEAYILLTILPESRLFVIVISCVDINLRKNHIIIVLAYNCLSRLQ